MNFIDSIKERAKSEIKTIVLPEAEDIRVLEAASKVENEGFAKIMLIGNKEKTEKLAQENNIDISRATLIDPETSEKFEEYSQSGKKLTANSFVLWFLKNIPSDIQDRAFRKNCRKACRQVKQFEKGL